MKFTEWRPIGVCDNGSPNRMKAKVFTRKDMAIITQEGVGRDNWQSSKPVMEVIRRYAKDVAGMSSMTRRMQNPVIKDIQLVGTVLQYGKTPDLNRESKDGRAQFFRITYEEGPPKPRKERRSFWKLWLLLLALVLLSLVGFFLWQQSSDKPQSDGVPLCRVPRTSASYEAHLQIAHNSLYQYVANHPSSNKAKRLRPQCQYQAKSIAKQEQRFLQCLQKAQRFAKPHALEEARECAKNICSKNIGALRKYCGKVR